MADIFLSYSSDNKQQVRSLSEQLEAEQFSVWWDNDLRAGNHWIDRIDLELKSATCVIVVWSENSVQSRWVKEEAYTAEKRGTLLPIHIDNVELPLGFRTIQSEDFTDWNGSRSHRCWQRLMLQVTSLIPEGTNLEWLESSSLQTDRALDHVPY
ncbi:toll/interleukin-1 receptor domain-containing protein [Parvularcula sp. IMCC14364]|uniref:toll/interleukin-1 receptor domain-containing protein n=1 Tax=Parvularcula sp. IMCC14364 TaxID=3067902 RepID=UPI0027418E68|nr:toll/interleukin-1 receptor domain-containing protein [Parvularcula sp. IMCC14364]